HSLEKQFWQQQPGTETVVYDGRPGIETTDFTGNGARAWDYVAHRFLEDSGVGSHQIENTTITVSRTNTNGRYELYLKHYVFDGKRTEKIPSSNSQPVRRLRLCCEVKKGSASHVLRFVFKGGVTQEALD